MITFQQEEEIPDDGTHVVIRYGERHNQHLYNVEVNQCAQSFACVIMQKVIVVFPFRRASLEVESEDELMFSWHMEMIRLCIVGCRQTAAPHGSCSGVHASTSYIICRSREYIAACPCCLLICCLLHQISNSRRKENIWNSCGLSIVSSPHHKAWWYFSKPFCYKAMFPSRYYHHDCSLLPRLIWIEKSLPLPVLLRASKKRKKAISGRKVETNSFILNSIVKMKMRIQ